MSKFIAGALTVLLIATVVAVTLHIEITHNGVKLATVSLYRAAVASLRKAPKGDGGAWRFSVRFALPSPKAVTF